MSTVRLDQSSQPLKIPSTSNSNGRPKPCLKPLPMPEYHPLPFSEYPIHSPHVHFPPTPTLTSTIFTHSAVQYDRAPIVVAENVCALPERGGRCYNVQLRNKRSSSRVRGCGHPPSSGVDIEEAEQDGSRILNPPELISDYFHPRVYEACEPERRFKDQQAQYNPYFASYSSSSSSSSSESESDLELSCNSLSPSIPHAVVDSLSLGGSPSSAYPLDSSPVPLQHGSQRPQFLHLSTSRQSHQQPQYLPQNTSYSSLPSFGESGQRRPTTSGGSRKVATGNMAARLAKFGGGFSDQSMALEGCLGGF